MSGDILIDVRGVKKNYDLPGEADVTVLDDLNLQVRKGEFLAILGPSGSGKSTFLRIMAGLIKPSAGEVLYKRRPLRGVNPGVAMVFQSFALYPWLTVRENVEMGLEPTGMSPAERRRRAEQAIDMVGLDGFESAFPKELSGGMRQRVGIARALVIEPDVLMMDEPFSALDVLTAENLRRDLLEMWIERKIPTRAIILVTHSIEEAVYMADRALVLSRDPARIIAEVQIPLKHWRDREVPEFKRLVDEIYSTLTKRRREGADQPEQPEQPVAPIPGEGKRGKVPPVRAGAMTGFVELIEEAGGKVDLYRLGDELKLDLEDLLPIVEGAELLGFCKVSEGDVELTPVGLRYAGASVLERKDLFREQARANVPALEQILRVLRSKANRRMPKEFFLNIFEGRYGVEEALHQLETLIDWGRYAEILAYDEHSRNLFIEDGQ
ncbi:MAG: nitrate/sulfonate/bicarbonate ABC transporter ATP-binding protein [Actinobacteria bacterium]|nr:nitrate/sulfonate/bicarbonate ABC transporter ATP-binding protein [Actinomycetota bacterium]